MYSNRPKDIEAVMAVAARKPTPARERATPRGPFDLTAFIEEMATKTIPGRLLERCRERPHEVAYRYKRLGIYQEVTWARLREHVEAFCLGLVELGLERGDRVAVMGDPCIEWVYADLGAQSAGAIVYGVYPTSAPSEVEYLMDNGGARFFVAQNQEHLDKILPVAERLPGLQRIIVADTRALFLYRDDPRLMTFQAVEELGRRRQEREPGLFEELIARIRPEDPAIIVYTSGTTGPPKGVVIAQRGPLTGYSTWLIYPELLQGKHRTVCALALAHYLERGLTVAMPLVADVTVHIGESVDSLAQTVFEVSPTFYGTVPRYWEKFASQVLVGIETSSWIKKTAYRWAMAIGRRYIQEYWQGRRPWWLWLLHWAAWWAVFRPILDKLGFARLRAAFSGAAPIPPEVHVLWEIWGVNLRDTFSQTECGGLITTHFEPFPKPGNVGKPLPCCQVRLDEEGEVYYKARSVFMGYWRSPEATAEALLDGWVRTGDVARWLDDGSLKLIDRKKDIMITAGGKNLTPTEIESALKASPYVSEAIVFADGRKYVAALIEIDYDTISDWARSNGVLYTGFTSLANHPRVYELIAGEVEKANEHLARVEQVKKFRIIPKELDPEAEGEPITPTRKVKRKVMYQRFKDLV
ncbi:MAG TPA: AMP-binding protein, partial [Dehalococcoidia bacterium]|nr:AMP-binding protein [Dehalococcoidia bacterium]